MASQVRIAVFDDHPLLREGVIHTLKKQPGIDVIGDGASAEEAIRFATAHKPDVMLLDVSMPGGGISAAHALKLSCPGVKTIMLTVSEREEDVSAAMEAGVRGYILKGVGGADLARIILSIAEGQTYVAPSLAARTLMAMQKRWSVAHTPKRRDADLTSREEQILDQASRGLTNKEIARHLQLSEKTIKHYMTSVLQKLQARNRVEAIIEARRRRIESATH
jgi:DNA-binding NarL/FixJ family response regulator